MSRNRDGSANGRGGATPVRSAARIMRQGMTPAESVLWGALRGRRLDGLRFRRQHPIGRRILDFYCPSARLAVEVDGAALGEPAADDAPAVVIAHGFRILHVRADEVLGDLPAVLARISAAAAEPASLVAP